MTALAWALPLEEGSWRSAMSRGSLAPCFSGRHRTCDERGFFCRTFDADVMRAASSTPGEFTQDSLSRSMRGVVRGLHVRRGGGEAKLVRCSYGEDLRCRRGPTARLADVPELGELRARRRRAGSLYVPAGCAHGSRPSPNRGRVLPDRPRHDPPRTCRSPSTTRNWPSRGPFPSALYRPGPARPAAR